ncbi:MAG: hypothetical protein FD189_2075 [Elusimicrobia bacterium]|nr:MAG: hypothetical protein FD154_1777 [Elusimicrobiota bacterium]KAF0154125.1 MAG: hypothetical protein FD189_2075 [Elusimicrobiota bacterium]
MELSTVDIGKGKRTAVAAGLFILFLAVYAFLMPPVLAPYRDAGELACDVYSLGIPHPPGYPLYVLAGRAFSELMPGGQDWKLNLFSAVAGAAAPALMFFFMSGFFRPAAALAAALLLGLNFTLITVSGVAEMYALHALFGVAIAFLAFSAAEKFSARKLYLLAFLCGLFLANRMDLMLVYPAVLALVLPRAARGLGSRLYSRALPLCVLFFLAGYSLYLYLPVRSAAGPFLDWGRPSDWDNFWGIITRRSYGSTLDLISTNYAKGELFLVNLYHYGLHLWSNMGPALAVAAAGVWFCWRRSRRAGLFWSLFFLAPGPLFLFLANMPPNPHALAVVEPYYLLPDLAVAWWLAEGLHGLFTAAPAWRFSALALTLAGILLFGLPSARKADRRGMFLTADYAADVMRGLPPGAVLVARKDVQLFSLWYYQQVEGLRPDVRVIAQGLSGASWYQAAWARKEPGFPVFNLNTGGQEAWAAAGRAWKDFYATVDSEIPSGSPTVPLGLVMAVYPPAGLRPPANPSEVYSHRWEIGRPFPDFFARDVISSYAQGALAAGSLHSSAGRKKEAAAWLDYAAAADPDLADAQLYSGFLLSSGNDWAGAGARFKASVDGYERLLDLAEQYRSLPDLKHSLRRSSAYAWLNYGVALEKTGDRDGAEKAYLRAAARNPELADANYNLAILYWNRDWDRVMRELSETLRKNPSHSQAAHYLRQLQSSRR